MNIEEASQALHQEQIMTNILRCICPAESFHWGLSRPLNASLKLASLYIQHTQHLFLRVQR